MINIRSESVKQKFVNIVEHNRCIVVVEGYYEWDSTNHKPYLISPKNEDLFYLAGVYKTDSES